MSSINKIKTNDITYDVEDTSKQGLLIAGENITIENNVISAQNSYVLPVADTDTLGGVKVGENLNIDSLGKLSSKNFNIVLKNVTGVVPSVVQSGDKYYNPSTNKIYTYVANAWDSGVVPEKGINYLNLEDTRLYLYDGTILKLPVDPYTLPIADTITLGGVKVGDNLNITASGVLSAVDTTYTAGDNISINSNNVISTPNSVGQVTTLPTASIDLLGKILQYVGETDSNYTNGYLYKCVSDGALDPTYNWERVDVQPEQESGPVYEFKLDLTNIGTPAVSIPDTENSMYSDLGQYITSDHKAMIAQEITKAYKENYYSFKIYLYLGTVACYELNLEIESSMSGNNTALRSKQNTFYMASNFSKGGTGFRATAPYYSVILFNIVGSWSGDDFTVSNIYSSYVKFNGPFISSNYLTNNWLAKTNLVAYTPSGDYNPATKKYVDDNIVKKSTLPTASSSNLGAIYQYTGTTDSNYTNGYFYKCVSDGANPATYSWVAIEVQESSTAEEPVGNVYQTYGVAWVYPTSTAHTLMTQVVNYFMKTGRIPNGVYQSTYGYNGRIIQITKRIEDTYVVFVVVFDGIKRDPVQLYGQKYYQVYPMAIQCYISKTDYDRGVATDVYNGSSLSNTRLDWSGTSLTTSNNLFVDYNDMKLIGKDNTISWTPAQDYGLVHKKYVDDKAIQVSSLPTADSSNVGKIYQYIGATDSNYTNGYFYQCVSDGAATPTYSWERIEVQPSSGASDPGVPTYTVSDNGNTYLHFKVNQKPSITDILNYVLSHNGNLPQAYFTSTCGATDLIKVAFTDYTTYVGAQLNFRGAIKRYNSDMGDGLSTLYSGVVFTVYLDPTEYANGVLTTVYYENTLDPDEAGECGWSYTNDTGGKVIQSGYDIVIANNTINKLTWASSIPSSTGRIYIYTGEVPNQQNYKFGHIYQCVNNPTLGTNEMIELKQASDSYEILMYDGTTSQASVNTVQKYWSNIKNGIPSVLLLVTDQYPSGSGSATSPTGKMIVPMSLDTTNPWSSTYRACLIGAAVSYDATGVFHAKQVLRFQDDTVTGLYTLQWKAPDGGSSGMSLTEWFQRSGLSEYSDSSTYAVGDFVYYSNQIYVCNTAIGTAESWDSTHWTQITYLDYLSRVLIGNALGGSY